MVFFFSSRRRHTRLQGDWFRRVLFRSPTTRTAQAFGKLVAWWGTLAEGGRSVFVGHDATKGGETDWPLTEYEAQIALSRAESSEERRVGEGYGAAWRREDRNKDDRMKR